MDGQPEIRTAMVWYHCKACDITALGVHTATMDTAWFDHMVTHDDPWDFERAAWEVVQLPFSDGPS